MPKKIVVEVTGLVSTSSDNTYAIDQIPIGDYGTDGYEEEVQIGQADSITFKVLK